ncbi:MAG: 4'-phosphopantetheinyl transferase superfamily protein [Bacteroidia bacterium]|nr:4'-phosphopantetheinyl transferase superfamily protein [Bacteroidia bacterium]
MPLEFILDSDDYKVGIWEICENETYFLDNYSYSEDELSELHCKKGVHRLQLLASRAILQELKISDLGYKIIKDNHGKPHVVPIQGDISVTHSHQKAAAIFAKQANVGIDIQIETERILKLAGKFISEDEFDFIEGSTDHISYYHIIWGAKESLYKAYGRRKVDFKKNLHVRPFVYNPLGGSTIGLVKMPDYENNFEIHYQKIQDYFFVYCIEHA